MSNDSYGGNRVIKVLLGLVMGLALAFGTVLFLQHQADRRATIEAQEERPTVQAEEGVARATPEMTLEEKRAEKQAAHDLLAHCKASDCIWESSSSGRWSPVSRYPDPMCSEDSCDPSLEEWQRLAGPSRRLTAKSLMDEPEAKVSAGGYPYPSRP